MAFSVLVGCSSEPGGGEGGSGPGATPADCFEEKPGCVLPSDTARIKDPSVSEEDLASLSRNNASFALDIGRTLHSSTNNVLYSPYSISTALAMSYAGARSETEKAIASTMHFELPQARLHPAFNYVDQQLQKRAEGASDTKGGGFRLHTANALWSQIGMPAEKPFLNVLSENYGARVRLADFSKPTEAEGFINTWVSAQTEGKIPKLLNKNVNTGTLAVLVNAIYFDAAWRAPFDEDATKPGKFERGDGSSVTVDRMNGTQETRYGKDAGWEAVELPYAGTPVSMFIVMPDKGTADTFEESLDGAALEAIIAKMDGRSVDVTMPKFSFDASASLKEALTDLGMGIAFGPGADFSGIFADGGIEIQDVIHKAVIDVNEAGTEAAAATAVLFATAGTGTYYEPAAIDIDRPFFFFITDVPTGAILFAGRVNDPTAH